MSPLRRGKDALIAWMLRRERALTAAEILEEMRRALAARRQEDGALTDEASRVRNAQLREDMEIVRRVGGLPPGQQGGNDWDRSMQG